MIRQCGGRETTKRRRGVNEGGRFFPPHGNPQFSERRHTVTGMMRRPARGIARPAESVERMLTAKQLLLKQTAEAFRGRADMPLMASLAGITQGVASWRPDAGTPTIEQIVRHVAWAKSHDCWEAFGRAMVLVDESVDAIGDSVDLPVEFPCGAGFGGGRRPALRGPSGCWNLHTAY